MRAAWLLLPLPLWAHSLHLSRSHVRVEPGRLMLEARIPQHEMAQWPGDPGAVLNWFSFGPEQQPYSLGTHTCHTAGEDWLCTAEYATPETVQSLTVRCEVAAHLSPDHLHAMQLERQGRSEQLIFSRASPVAIARWRQISPWRRIGVEPWLACVLAGSALGACLRSRRMAALAILAGVGGSLLASYASWHWSVAAAALTVAYAGVELWARATPWAGTSVVACSLGLLTAATRREAGNTVAGALAAVCLAAVFVVYGLSRRWRIGPWLTVAGAALFAWTLLRYGR